MVDHKDKLNTVLRSLLILILLVGCAGAATTWTVDPTPEAGDFTTIQAAINAANATDTILVDSGNYPENVVVNKQLTLRGNDTGSGLPIVDARRLGNGITLSADGCTLEGFMAKNAGSSFSGILVISHNNTISGNEVTGNINGIHLDSSKGNIVTGNTATANYCGIRLYSSSGNTVSENTATRSATTGSTYGIYLSSSSGNTISKNIATNNNNCGIYLVSSSNGNTISGNTATGNGEGIYLESSSDNTIEGNAATGNGYGIDLKSSSDNTILSNTVTNNFEDGIYLEYSDENAMSDNTATGNSGNGVCLSYSCGNTIEGNNASYNRGPGIRLISSERNSIIGNTATNSVEHDGIWLSSSSNNIIMGNILTDNHTKGIALDEGSNDNTITGNTANDNIEPGIFLFSSDGNTIYQNTFNNTNNVWSDSANTWHSPTEIEYMGNTTYVGNRWSDYSGTDGNGDGIGDSPYIIPDGSEKDDYPIMTTFVGPSWSIQAAINAASASSTIIVRSGTYYENVVVNKTLTLIGIDTGGGLPVVDARQLGSAIELTADGCTLEGFVARNASHPNAGIWVTSDGNTISDNTVTGNADSGIKLEYSDENTITGNIATDNVRGIWLRISTGNTISGNTATGNVYGGISLSNDADDNTISGNTATDNDENGIRLESSSGNTIESNKATDNSLSGIYLTSSSNNNWLSGNTASGNNVRGILLFSSNGNTISGNTVTCNMRDGILLFSSNGNTISGNTATDNNYGIYLTSSSNNIIYLNNFNNNHNAYSGSANSWNSTTTVTWEYKGRNLTGFLGNVWSDYDGFDCDGDGIGDMPYDKIEGGSDRDYHPIGGKLCGSRIEVEKIADRAEAEVGEVINYTIFVNNTGNVNLTGVWAEDNLTNDVWDVGDLGPGQNFTNTTGYLVNETDLPGPIINELRANGTDPCGFDVNDSCVETVSIFCVPGIAVNKTANVSFAEVGDVVEYTIRVNNTGNVNLTKVVASDNLTGDVWNIGTLAPGKNYTNKTSYVVRESDLCKPLVNNLSAEGEVIGTGVIGNFSIVSIDTTCTPGIVVNKTANISSAEVGDVVGYTIQVNNTGNVNLTGVSAFDNLTGGAWNIGTLAPGDGRTFKTTYRIKESDLGHDLVNNATANGTGPCGVRVANYSIVSIDTTFTSGIEVEKTANVSSAEVGDVVGYTIRVNNTGNVNLTKVVASDNLTGDAWDIGTLAPGKNYTNKTSYVVRESDLCKPLVNNLSAEGEVIGTGVIGNFSIVSIDTTCTPMIEINKTANVSSAEIGDVVDYTILVNNTGNVNLTGVSAFDNLTGGAWNIGTLAPGDGRTFKTAYRIKESDLGHDLVNNATANGTDPCGFEVNDSAIETVSILYDPGIEVEKITNLSFGAPSTTIEFTINVTNTGNVNFSTVNLTDNLPAGLEYVSDDQTTRTIDGDNVTWNLGPLNRTDTRTIKLAAHIDGTVFGTLENRAEAAGTAPLGDEVTDGDDAEVEALKAEIEVEKTGKVDYGPDSTNATFAIKVENAGNITLKKVEVVDVLPAGLVYLSSSPSGTEVGKTIIWPDIGSLAETGTAEIKIFTRVDDAASGSLTNEVTVTGTPEHGRNVTDQANATVMATLDFGDAPDSYSTLLSTDGARHVIVPGFMLGSKIDGEHNGQPRATADGDDLAGVDDEDGVTFTTYLVPGGFANVVVEATASGNLDAWIDFDDDGIWTATDQIFDSEPIASGTNYLQFHVLETATPDPETFARFRFSSAGGLSPSGLADDGEVEDYAVEIMKDSDGDGAPDLLEGDGDHDGDGVPDDLDYDPSGRFYNESDGQIITGGKISVTGPGNVTIVEDGSGGRYEFWTDGTPGIYEMELTFPAGYIPSPTCPPQNGSFDPTNQLDDPVYLGSGENGATGYLASHLCPENPYYLRFELEPGDPFVMTNNIPLAHLNSIGDRVWNDLDGDGRQDDDEAGVSDVPVTLLDENGTKVAETVTGPGGIYLFSDLLPGGYRIQFDAPSGCSFCPCHQCDECLDSDPDPRTGLTDLIVLETNENEMTIDAGLHTSLNVSKTVDKKSAKRGEELTYTIRICNEGSLTATNVVVEDVFDRSVELVSADPMPDPDGLWRFDEIPAGECVTITLVVRVPKQDLEFEMGSGVSGRGYVNVADDYSTTLQPYVINNRVKVASGGAIATDSESVSISADPGTELETREHGSGSYESEEQVKMRTENKSISMDKDVSATYAPTTLGLYRNRTAVYTSKWTEEARAKNRITGASMSESYRYASSIDRESRMFLDENESVMEIDSEFDGMGHVGFLKKGSGSGAESASSFEAREDYVGSFKVLERTGEYGSAVSSEKSASGEGLVAVDKRVGTSQRSYESGTGAYDSEELIETSTNYIAKEISLVSGRMNHSSTDDFSINFDQKWKEGMYSKTAGTSLIGEEYTSITELDKETVARGLNEMDTLANFSGRARFRAVLRDEVDVDEQYEGDYSIERRILFTGVPKYDRPHLNVTKTLDGVVEETIFGDKEETLAGESRNRVVKVATYTIRIENDGNKALGPIRARDIFPPGAVYINASVRPSELTDSYANWTLTHLAIGDVSAIVLNLDVTEHTPAELVNRVEVCGGIDGDDEQVCASNFSALEVEWLACCPEETISVVKTAQGASSAKNRVLYGIEIENRANVTRVAEVTDSLPSGMVILDARVPFASYENGTVVWNVVIGPFETVTIDYLAEALWSGRFTNSVEVDARSIDGAVVQPVTASSVVEVGEFEDERRPAGWQPPDWGFVSVCDEC